MIKINSYDFVGERNIMKKYIWAFLFLASTCYADVNQTGPYLVKSLQNQVSSLTNENNKLQQINEQLKKQLADKNEQFKRQLADKDREIERLKHLCIKNNIDPNEQFSFRGAHIGDPKSKMQDHFSDKPLIKQNNGLEIFRDTSIKEFKVDSWQAYLGDIPIESLDWEYLDDKLVGFSVIAKSTVFEKFRDYLIARYGQPDKIKKGTVQNAMGATFPSITLVWNTPDGLMLLMNPSTNIDEVALSMTQFGINEELDRRDKEIAKQNAGKAF